jgi:hypothetical protein
LPICPIHFGRIGSSEYPEAPADAADLRQIAMIGRAGIAAYFSQQAAENREQLRGAGVERPDIITPTTSSRQILRARRPFRVRGVASFDFDCRI